MDKTMIFDKRELMLMKKDNVNDKNPIAFAQPKKEVILCQ